MKLKTIIFIIELVVFIGVFIVGSIQDFPYVKRVVANRYFYLENTFETFKTLDNDLVISDPKQINALRKEFSFEDPLISVHIKTVRTSTNTFQIPEYNIIGEPSGKVIINSNGLDEAIKRHKDEISKRSIIFFVIGLFLLLLKFILEITRKKVLTEVSQKRGGVKDARIFSQGLISLGSKPENTASLRWVIALEERQDCK